MTFRQLTHLENIPVYQNKMFDDAECARACARGDLLLAQDCATGLVSNVAFDPSRLDYDTSYQNEQGHSTAFQDHLAGVLATVGRHFDNAKVLEIGCGKGVFLDLLRSSGFEAIGVDPAYGGDSPFIIKTAFEPGSGLRGDAIVMRHVLEHIPDPVQFLDSIRRANGGQGKIYIEVPCLDWILGKRAWFDLFYEHVNYFRLGDFQRMFGRVLESGHLFGGQYLFAVADLASLRAPEAGAADAALSLPEDFFSGVDACVALSRPGVERVVWGGAAKGVMFSHHMTARGLDLEFVVDINPAKQGKFLASSALPVVSPEALRNVPDGTQVFVMNPNYLQEIESAAGPRFEYIPMS